MSKEAKYDLAVMSHSQHDRCAICLTRPCLEKDEPTPGTVRGLLCPCCHELVTLMPYQWMKEEYKAGKKRMEEDGKYSFDSGTYRHDLFTMRWALEYLEEAEGIGPDDPTLFHTEGPIG